MLSPFRRLVFANLAVARIVDARKYGGYRLSETIAEPASRHNSSRSGCCAPRPPCRAACSSGSCPHPHRSLMLDRIGEFGGCLREQDEIHRPKRCCIRARIASQVSALHAAFVVGRKPARGFPRPMQRPHFHPPLRVRRDREECARVSAVRGAGARWHHG